MARPESWLPVVGYEGRYEISDHGRVRSLHGQGRLMTLQVRKHGGHLSVLLKAKDKKPKNITVHTLVMSAFSGPRPEGMEVCHNNGDPTDNRLENLRYGTASENHLDRVRHGVHHQTRKTHCTQGHPYSGANLYVVASEPRHRKCRICTQAAQRRYKAKARARLAS